MARETLPVDGARYRCGYGFTRYEDWRCDRDATEALDPESFMRYTGTMTRHEVIHGRAMCENHLANAEDRIRT